jgi:hypothetical protein
MEKNKLKEALIEYNQLKEAATARAKNLLAEEYPAKISELIKEEFKKNKKSTEESDKDDVDKNKESEESDDKKNKDSVMKTKETEKKVKGKDIPAKDVIKEEFDQTEGDANAGGMSLTMEDIERELSEFDNMSDTGEEAPDGGIEGNEPEGEEAGEKAAGEEVGDDESVGNELIELRNKLDSIIAAMGLEGTEPETDVTGDTEAGAETSFDDSTEAGAEEGLDSVYEIELPSDDEIDSALQEEEFSNEPEVDESHGLSYTARRNNTGRHTPNNEYLSAGEKDQSPAFMQESKKKVAGLINENKAVTKKLNATIKLNEEATAIIDKYKTALGKYRTQLKEMAVFNTNLAHVNNILINEELALTQQEKLKVINEFKNINDITESQNKYKSVISEMKKGKKPITESLEAKVSASIQPSSKQKLDEVSEKTTYINNEHMRRMQKVIDYVEKR